MCIIAAIADVSAGPRQSPQRMEIQKTARGFAMSNINTAMESRSHKRRCVLSPFSTLTLLGFLLLLISCGQNGTGSGISTSSVVNADNQPAANVVAGTFTTLHMINAMIGWAIGWDISGSSTYMILKTTDGGRH